MIKNFKDNKVVGLVAIAAIEASLNSDFSGSPKMHMGRLVASPFAIKYPTRRLWHCSGEKVLITRTYKPMEEKETGTLQLRDLNEGYERLFGEKVTKKSKGQEVVKNLLSCIDVMNFGVAFAIKEANTQITGVVQFNTGVNKYEDSEIVRDVVTTQFRNSNKEEAKQSTLGQRSVVTEAHYFYDFRVNPLNLIDFTEVGLPGYTQEAYEMFKKSCFNAVTNLNTVSKIGCSNEFAMFIELKDGSDILVGDLNDKVIFKKVENRKVIDLSVVASELDIIEDSIETVEMYYNPLDTDVIFDSELLKSRVSRFYITRPSKEIK